MWYVPLSVYFGTEPGDYTAQRPVEERLGKVRQARMECVEVDLTGGGS